jgi:long-chain acyl-CoA synthetase
VSLKLSSADLLHLRPWRRAVEEPQHPSYVRHVDGEWQTVTARDHLGRLVKVARGLVASGIEAGDRVAIMSSTRYSWVLLDEAIWSAGAVTVPVYPSSSQSQLAWIVEDSGAKILVVESADQAALADGLDVEVLVLADGALETLGERGFTVEDQDLARRRDGVTIGAPASIVYTSGTTGRPKGVVLTHRNLAAEVAGILGSPAGSEAVDGRRLLMFLPMAHVLARAVTHAGAQGGMTVGFWRDFGTLTSALTSFNPHIVLGVPRVFEKVHDAIRSSAEEGGRASAEVFRRGSKVAIEWSRDLGGDGLGDARLRGPRLRTEHALFDRLLYSKIREALGGECCYAISGGGALDPRLQHFFRGAGVPIYEGYG